MGLSGKCDLRKYLLLACETCNLPVRDLPVCFFPTWGVELYQNQNQTLYTPVHLVESVENYALCMRRCLLCSSNMSVTHSALLREQIILTPAPSIRLCAIASYCLFHSHAQIVSFTDSMMWTGILPVMVRWYIHAACWWTVPLTTS